MTPRPWEPEAVALRRAERRRRRTMLIVAATTAVVVLFAVVVAIVAGDDDGNVRAGATTQNSRTGSTVTTARSSTTAGRSPTTAGTSTTTFEGSTTTVPSGSSSSNPAGSTTPGATTVAVPTTIGGPTSAAPSPSPVPPTEAPTTTPTTATPPPTAVPGTIDNPVRLGTAAPIGEGWELSVSAYVPDATAEVVAEDEFNEPPDEGFQYALATVAVTYKGSDPTTSLFAIDVGVVAPDGFETDMFSCPVVVPRELDTSTEVFPGDTVTGNVCLEVPTASATSVVMYAIAGFDTDDIYFALI